jgi:hypothetical protein
MDDVMKSIRAAMNVRSQRIYNVCGGETEERIQKAEETTVDDIEKSDIMNAIQYGGNIQITKTGKEIKESVQNILIPELNAQLEEKKTAADNLLEDCGDAPRHSTNPWWTDDLRIEVPYKIYEWNEMEYNDRSQTSVMGSLSAEHSAKVDKKYNFSKSVEEAEARRKYNEEVRAISNILVDLRACEILLQIKDNKEYALTPKQLATFRL